MKTIIGILFSFVFFSTTAQDIQEGELKKLEGLWKGSLTYTDYGDDKSKVNLTADLEIIEKNGKLAFRYTYFEPNGDEVKRKGSMYRGKSADRLEFGSSWQIQDFKRTKEGWKMKLFTTGKDNDKNSEIKMTVDYTGTDLVYIKSVKYDDGDKFFERNRHEFTRE